MSTFVSGKSRNYKHNAKAPNAKNARYNFNWISKDLELVDDIKSREKLLEKELKEIKAEESAISREITKLKKFLK